MPEQRHDSPFADRNLSTVIMLSGIGFLVATVLAVGTTGLRKSATVDIFVGVSAGFAVFGIALALFFLMRVAGRTRYGNLRVALTGEPGAGKTVLANLLLDRLMNGTYDGVAFTADSATAIAVYQNIRGMSERSWPAETVSDFVIRYVGELEYSSPRRTVVELEIGDSAGQHWVDLNSQEDNPSSRSYLAYVISAKAIVHVIDSETFLTGAVSAALDRDFQDLGFATQLARSARGKSTDRACLIALTKIDELVAKLGLGPLQLFLRSSVLENRQYEPERLAREVSALRGSGSGVRDVAENLMRVCEFARDVSVRFQSVGIVLTSAPFQLGGEGGRTASRSDDALVSWIRYAADGANRRDGPVRGRWPRAHTSGR
jgi:hypothetical protein